MKMRRRKEPDVPRARCGARRGAYTAPSSPSITPRQAQRRSPTTRTTGDKEPLFDAADTLADTFNPPRRAAGGGTAGRTGCARRSRRASPRRPTFPTTSSARGCRTATPTRSWPARCREARDRRARPCRAGHLAQCAGFFRRTSRRTCSRADPRKARSRRAAYIERGPAPRPVRAAISRAVPGSRSGRPATRPSASLAGEEPSQPPRLGPGEPVAHTVRTGRCAARASVQWVQSVHSPNIAPSLSSWKVASVSRSAEVVVADAVGADVARRVSARRARLGFV